MLKIIQNGVVVSSEHLNYLSTLNFVYDTFLALSEYTLLSETVQAYYKRATYRYTDGTIVTVAISFATL